MALAERAVREGCPGNHEHPKEPGEKSPTERRLSQKIGGTRHKKAIFSFSTFAQDWHSGVLRAKTKSYSTDRGLGNWERKGEIQKPYCQMPYAYLLTVQPFHTIPYSGKNELCLYDV